MKRCLIVTGAAALLLGASMAVSSAADAKKEAAEPAKASRVLAPYHDLELSDEQKSQVAAIQADYRARIEALEDERNAKIEALLSDEQVASVRAQEVERAKRREEYRKAYIERRKAESAKAAEDAAKN